MFRVYTVNCGAVGLRTGLEALALALEAEAAGSGGAGGTGGAAGIDAAGGAGGMIKGGCGSSAVGMLMTVSTVRREA